MEKAVNQNSQNFLLGVFFFKLKTPTGNGVYTSKGKNPVGNHCKNNIMLFLR
jgi:hypothetical protein